MEIQEPGPGDLDPVDRLMQLRIRHEFHRHIARLQLEHFGQPHRGIALVVAKGLIRGRQDIQSHAGKVRPRENLLESGQRPSAQLLLDRRTGNRLFHCKTFSLHNF
jgi:hypothetical protein